MKTLEEIAKSATKTDPKTDTVEKLKAARAKLLPVEETLRKDLDTKLRALTNGKPELDAKYPRIDMDFVMSRFKRQAFMSFPVPRFVALNVEKDSVSFNVWGAMPDKISDGSNGDEAFNIAVTEQMKKGLARRISRNQMLLRLPVFAALGGLVYWAIYLTMATPLVMVPGIGSLIAAGVLIGSFTNGFWDGCPFLPIRKWAMSAKLGGAIPEQSREIIQNARKEFQKVFLICEVNKWSLKETSEPQPTDPDPLVVGCSNGAYYLVHKFDLTNAEDWLAREAT